MQLWSQDAPRWRMIGSLLRSITAEEQTWRQHPIPVGDGDYGFLPYPIPQFITYLADAVSVAPGPRFLDVGAGPGTKMLIARDMFGLDVAGIEIVPDFVKAGTERGLTIVQADARSWGGYAEADICYLDRPCEDQEPLEAHIMDLMRPGAVLISVNGRRIPSQHGWSIVAEEFGEPARGVWQRPYSASDWPLLPPPASGRY